MPLTGTTLAAPMAAADLSFRATSVTGAIVNGIAKVDNEYMKVVQVIAPIVWVRERGGEGGTATDHAINATVVFGIGSELPALGIGETAPTPTEDRDVISISDGVVGGFKRNTNLTLAKATAGAITLEAPSLALDGLRLDIVSASAAAHVVTGTGLFDDGVTGGSKNTLTFAAFIGASAALQAQKGKWAVVALKAVTCP